MKIIKLNKGKRHIAVFFALNILLEALAPMQAFALTGGPSQPEVDSFEPIGTTEMVDLFTGDFNYNIPLFDIGGYPVNISYHGGVSMDQESSWVGLGWNINPGVINRGMRGIPDDFLGENIHYEMNLKENYTKGYKYNMDAEIFGVKNYAMGDNAQVAKKGKRMHQYSKWNFGFGIVHNSYKGVGYSLDISKEMSKTSLNAKYNGSDKIKGLQNGGKDYLDKIDANKQGAKEHIDYVKNKATELKNEPGSSENRNKAIDKIAGDLIKKDGKTIDQMTNIKDALTKDPSKLFKTSNLKGNLSLSMSSQDGASLGFSFSFSQNIDKKSNRSITPNIGLGYNSFIGMTSFDVGLSYSKGLKEKNKTWKNNFNSQSFGTSVPIGSITYSPNIQMSTLSSSLSYNGTLGFDLFGFHPDVRVSGFYNTESLEKSEKDMKAYGFLYEQESYWNRESDFILMDFNREKESALEKSMTHLPLMNHTYDVYSVSGQGTGGMYRPHRKTIGLLHDNYSRNRNRSGDMNEIGLELGFGSNFHAGASFKNKVQKTSTGLWANHDDNQLMDLTDYRRGDNDNDEVYKQVYFKAAGEQTPSDNYISNSWGGKQAVSLKLSKTPIYNRNLRFGKLNNELNQGYGDLKYNNLGNPIRNNVITFLTAEECSHNGLGADPYIISYPQNYWTNYIKSKVQPKLTSYNRFGGTNGAAAHHISQIVSLGTDGMRYVYGIPAYNTSQREVNFAVSKDIVGHGATQSARVEYPSQGLVKYVPGEGDNTRFNQRGSDNFFMAKDMPSYAHSYLLTGVLSPDYVDLTGDGITDDDYGSAVKFNYQKTSSNYKWRSPYEKNMAMLDEGYITDNSDNKASYTYGEKEVWYLQSMESKTHIAEFKLSARKDGHGVSGENGGLSTANSNSLMKLDSIVIYSKLDIMVNGSKALPIKVIVFNYDYSLCSGLPNSQDGGGKLTLKSIYFTYGKSGKGKLNPYRFEYSNLNPSYSHVHYDRWGSYKYADEKLPNRYFPYVDQGKLRDTLDSYASAWTLSAINLPSGGKIEVEYEADDYAYVQNRKAMQMMKIIGTANDKNLNKMLLKSTENVTKQLNTKFKPQANYLDLYEGRVNNNYLIFKLNESPEEITENGLKYIIDKYLTDENGEYLDQIYYRFKVNMDPKGLGADNFEYVSGYAQIEPMNSGISSDKLYGYVQLKEVNQGDVGLTKCNPICKQAWQDGLQSLRKVIYPGSDLSQAAENGSEQDAIMGLKNSFSTVLNVFTGPYQNLRWKNIAKHFEIDKSFIRLYNHNGRKVGGGCRVKRITINDNWSEMDNTDESGQYGQEFFYETKNEQGDVISSGVASYEPFVGNDENPFRNPVFHKNKRPLFPDVNQLTEEPFGESFFPDANVGYSRVVVRNIPKPNTKATSTGKVVHEFFTSKDFPTITKITPLRYITNGSGTSQDGKAVKAVKKFTKSLKSMFNLFQRDYFAATQGYTVILNDMHGKVKSTSIYSSIGEVDDVVERNFTGNLISGSEYKYKTESTAVPDSFTNVLNTADSVRFKPVPKGAILENTVWVMNEKGQLEKKEIATTYDVAIDARESKSHFRNAGLDWNNENFMLAVIPCPWPKYQVTQNMFQCAVVTKVVQQYGIIDEVVAYDHSSIVKTKNLVWDEQTGDVLLTTTTNEFDDPLYNFTYPAHLAYAGMGPAYKNIDFQTYLTLNGSGYASYDTADAYNGKFYPGDELLMRSSNDVVKRGWVLKANQHTDQLQLIDRNGNAISGTWNVKVIRSGRRNLSSTPVGALVTMNERIFRNNENDNRLFLEDKIVQSQAIAFSDNWPGYYRKGLEVYEKCDTFELSIEQIFGLIRGTVLDKNDSNTFDYFYNDTLMPSDISQIANYDDTIRNVIEKFSINKLKTTCGTVKGTSIKNIYFGRGYGVNNRFFLFKAKYRCPNDHEDKLLTFDCEVYTEADTSTGNLDISQADSISELTLTTEHEGTFKVYKDGDSCTYNLSYGAECFRVIECYDVSTCDYYYGKNINPYVNNLRGVWRQKEAFAFNSEREYQSNIRQDGFIKNYVPYWKFNDIDSSSGIKANSGVNFNRWVSTGKASIYSPEGNGLEEINALGIYSSQLYGYNNLLVTAQASNAQLRQIAFDNFEDYFSPVYTCYGNEEHFNFKEGLDINYSQFNFFRTNNSRAYSNYIVTQGNNNSNAWIARDTSHTGLFSMGVGSSSEHSVVKKLKYLPSMIYSGNDSFFRMNDTANLIKPFSPIAGKYVVSLWVMEKHSDMNSINSYENAKLNIKVYSGGSVVSTNTFTPNGMIIDKWQRINGVFTVPSGADSIKVTLLNDGEVIAYFDDIRIHPFNSQFVSNVYHFTNLKVLATLDDNNYATFYEYDDEGTLIRVKRETERGIITIQENRKSIKKTNP